MLSKKSRKFTEKDRKQIERAREEIRHFERKYNMSSEEFFKKWQTSKELLNVDDADANLWVTHLVLIGKEN